MSLRRKLLGARGVCIRYWEIESQYCRDSRNDAEEGRSKGNGNERGRERQKNRQEMREIAGQRVEWTSVLYIDTIGQEIITRVSE